MIRQLDNRIVYTYILDSVNSSVWRYVYNSVHVIARKPIIEFVHRPLKASIISICDPVNSYTSVTVSVYSPLFASSNSIRSSIQTKLEHFCPYIG